MAETTIRTLVCSVMFLDIVDYSKRSVGDQQHMKQTFNELLARALEPVPPRDFIVLDTGDGAAIAFLGDPEDALSAGIAVLPADGEDEPRAVQHDPSHDRDAHGDQHQHRDTRQRACADGKRNNGQYRLVDPQTGSLRFGM